MIDRQRGNGRLWRARVPRLKLGSELSRVFTYPVSRLSSLPRSPRDARCTRRDPESPGRDRTPDNPAGTGQRFSERIRSGAWSLKLIGEGDLATVKGQDRNIKQREDRWHLSGDFRKVLPLLRMARQRRSRNSPLLRANVCDLRSRSSGRYTTHVLRSQFPSGSRLAASDSDKLREREMNTRDDSYSRESREGIIARWSKRPSTPQNGSREGASWPRLTERWLCRMRGFEWK